MLPLLKFSYSKLPENCVFKLISTFESSYVVLIPLPGRQHKTIEL